MSELLLIKQPLVLTEGMARGLPLPVEQVVGLETSDEAIISEYNYSFTGDEREEVLTLSDATVEGIVEFYKRTRARPAEERPNYSCHTFTYFVLGAIATIKYPDQFFYDRPVRQWRTNHLAAGRAYITRDYQGVPNHSILGINRPAFNLCVPGNNRPLSIFSNRDIMRIYDVGSLYRYHPGRMNLRD